MFAIDVQLLDGRYDAALTDRAAAEWPPHPARMFCALVAGARTDAEWDALRWLERQDAPDVVAAGGFRPLRRAAFVVTNRREGKGGSQFHPGRTNQLRTRMSAQPESDHIRFEWPGADADATTVAVLDRLALRVPYFGRSTTAVLAEATTGAVDDDDRSRFEPCDLTDAEFDVRVPYVGYVDALREAYDAGRPAADAARLLGYRMRRDPADEPIRYDSPFRELIVVRTPEVRPDGRLAPLFTNALRSALLKRIPKPVPDIVHGHGVDDRVHVGFVALPVSGKSEHDRGHLVGLALALPTMAEDERRAVLRALVGDPTAGWSLDVPGLGEYTVRFDRGPQQSLRSSAEYWTARSHTWVTATPMALDRHPKKGDDVAELIAHSCVLAGYPEPIDVTVSHAPMAHGGVQLRASDLPDWLRHRPLRHVRLQFDGELLGPVLVGAGRFLGVGLFLPEREQ